MTAEEKQCLEVVRNELRHIRESLTRIESELAEASKRITLLENWRIALVSSVAVLLVTKYPELKSILIGF